MATVWTLTGFGIEKRRTATGSNMEKRYSPKKEKLSFGYDKSRLS